ncbi:uncharacterized protein LOC106874510 [Octopus bimaculoides]|uniref:uncharacterized protein LOC106874510 n=1 Tax=Octopus bimaculoides TaxID=37653 RepID=UPI00071DEE11|nr:uncharacterized protein LOC106874510 [Octopus bimaculoides]|eukprot:XP_014777749.1 PREDICTED: uncharacterized protein LOC106874510 [Octopus bimaculoides]
MPKTKEKRVSVKFCFQLVKNGGRNSYQASKSLQGHCQEQNSSLQWFLCFRNGHSSLDDQPGSGRPLISQMNEDNEDITKIYELILEDRHLPTDKLVGLSDVSWSSYQRMLSEELQMKRVAAKFVTRLLTRSKAVTTECVP